MSDTKHTPTPLEAKREDATHAVLYGSNGMLVARIYVNEHAWERAQEIATACNAHDALVAALEAEDAYWGALAADEELRERAYAEGWDNDPTGSSHLSSSSQRVNDARTKANELRAAALKLARGES